MDVIVSGMLRDERTKHFIMIVYRLLLNLKPAKWSLEAYQAKGLDVSNLLQEV